MLPVRRGRGWNSFFKEFDELASAFSEVFDDTVCYSVGEDRVFELEVPGFNETNINVELSNGILTIKGTREVKEGCYAGRKEIYKRYTVGSHEEVDASIKDGILRLTLKTPKEDVKKIELKSN